MRIEDILTLPISKQLEILCVEPEDRNVEEWQDDYDGEHDILDTAKRPDKTVGTGDEKKTVEVARNVVTLQKKITRIATAFLFGEPVKLVLKSDADKYQQAYDAIRQVWYDNKLDYFNRSLMRSVCIETDAAELWYVSIDPETNEKKYRVILLSEATGNRIYPHFDDNGDMDAFVRKYTTNYLEGDMGLVKKKDVIEIYLAGNIIVYEKNGTEWQETRNETTLYKKIPVIYYQQDAPEWADVQTLIDRLEMVLSRHSDTNDYYGAPILKIFGEIVKLPDKTEDGRILQFKSIERASGGFDHGDAEYISWDASPESIKLEVDNLLNLIYSLTSTPDISFDKLRGIANISGVALRMMFLDAMLKAREKQEIYGEGLQRRINLLKELIGSTNVALAPLMGDIQIGIEFHDPLPQNIMELVESLSVARGGEATISRETAVKRHPYVEDPQAELEAIEAEKQSAVASLGESYEV